MVSDKKLCIFIHFSKCPFIPRYVRIFLAELGLHFDEIILIHNKRPIKREDLESVGSKLTRISTNNEGYDLGMFYKALNTIDLHEYSQIACINDSNILFNKLDPLFKWGNKQRFDFWGTVDSYQKPWFSTHQDNYHIQSHFMVFNKNAINLLPKYFDSLDMKAILQEKDLKKLRQMVIDKWEIGLTQFLVQNGLTIGSYFNSRAFSVRHNLKKNTNLSSSHYFRLIEDGYPLIKKKITHTKNRIKLLFRPHLNWDRMILKYGDQNWDLEELIKEVKEINKTV